MVVLDSSDGAVRTDVDSFLRTFDRCRYPSILDEGRIGGRMHLEIPYER